MAELTAHVSFFDDKGALQQFGPGDDVPSWARKLITNPNVWDGEEDAPSAAPPKAGKGSGLEAWKSYAESRGIVVTDDASREDIIAACEEAELA